MMKRHILPSVVLAALVLPGCQSAGQHRQAVRDTEGEQLTVGTVQREIRVGMSGAEVAEVLGSPNVVTTDEQRREVWIYDKISTEHAYSTSSGGISALILAGAGSGNVAGGGGGSANIQGGAGAAATSQRTLTVIIKFDADRRVRDFAYHTSRF